MTCEWCDKPAVFVLQAEKLIRNYERFACEEHIWKVRRQAKLDGYSDTELVETNL